jgi:NAD(P)-dependent dehydrogenase (short-subunit alcohol dehydrogenase family)
VVSLFPLACTSERTEGDAYLLLPPSGTGGLGLQTVIQLAKHNPRQIVFTGRNRQSAEKVIETAGSTLVSFIASDMTSLASVKDAASQFLAQWDRLDVLVENAGIFAPGAGDVLTKDGYEPIWGVNYLAHALLEELLLPLLRKTAATAAGADVRIVILSSALQRQASSPGINYESLRSFKDLGFQSPIRRYTQSKFANMLHADQLAIRYPDIVTVSVHPGLVMTEMIKKASWILRVLMHLIAPVLQPEQGAYSQLWAITTDRKNIVNGGYYEPVGVLGVRSKFATEKNAVKLWEWTEGELKAWL